MIVWSTQYDACKWNIIDISSQVDPYDKSKYDIIMEFPQYDACLESKWHIIVC